MDYFSCGQNGALNEVDAAYLCRALAWERIYLVWIDLGQWDRPL